MVSKWSVYAGVSWIDTLDLSVTVTLISKALIQYTVYSTNTVYRVKALKVIKGIKMKALHVVKKH